MPATSRSVTAVPVPDHAHHAPNALVEVALAAGVPIATTAYDPAAALRGISRRTPFGGEPATVIICGSLYLAGEVLAENDEWPD